MQRAGSILSLFAAEEIPAAMITFVSLLLFLQTGTSAPLSVCYSSLLFLPWVLKSFLREKVRRRAHFRRTLQWCELLLVLCLLLLALALYPTTRMFRLTGLSAGTGVGIFILLFAMSFITAWHELAARMYYERMLRPRMQRFYNGPKVFVSQMMVVFTYGLLIIFVGTLEVLCRSIFIAWSMGMLLTALVLSLFFLYHLFSLQACPVGDNARTGSMLHAVKAELHILERVRKRTRWYLPVLLLFLLLLPQSLMFYSRVLFFITPTADGGLGRSIQDVGFAQGVVGVLAFCVGISLGRYVLGIEKMNASSKRKVVVNSNASEKGSQDMNGRVKLNSNEKNNLEFEGKSQFWLIGDEMNAHLFPYFFFILTLSPFVYLFLTGLESLALWQLCLATFFAQFCFGFGLNACHPFVHAISGGRYRNTINYLYVPLVAAVMIAPVLLSGFLANAMGYKNFFLLDSLCAPVAWIAIICFEKMTTRTTYKTTL